MKQLVKLRTRPSRDGRRFVYFLDHLDEHGKRSAYDGGLRTPLIMHWPTRIPPSRHAMPTSAIDFLPTVLEASGVSSDEDLPGRSLLSIATGQKKLAHFQLGSSRGSICFRRKGEIPLPLPTADR